MISHVNPIQCGLVHPLGQRVSLRGEIGARSVSLFLSTFVNKVDKKGRVSVPASFRASLSSQAVQGLIAFRSFTNPCIDGCGWDRMEEMSNAADSFAAFSAEQDDMSNLIFADARQLSWDAEGRVVLPEDLMAHAGITERAAFVGKGKTFQIWNPDQFEQVQADIRARAMQKRPTLPMTPGPEGGAA